MTEEERDQIICMDTSQPAAVESIVVHCVKCDRKLWRSVGSLAQDCDPICMWCLPADAKPKAAMPQVEQVARELGLSVETMIDRFEAWGIGIADG